MYDDNILHKSDRIINLFDRLRVIDMYSSVLSSLRSQVAIILYHHIGNNNDDYLLNKTNTSDFERQMRYLKTTHEIITFQQLIQAITGKKKSLPRKAAIITFDDGYKDNFNEAYPILRKYNIPATIFLTTGHIETDNIFWWNKIGYALCHTKLKKIELDDFENIYTPPLENRFYFLRKTYQKFKKIPDDRKKKLINLLIQKLNVEIPKDMNRDLMLTWENIKEMNENGIDFGAHTVTHPILTNISLDQVKLEILESKKIIEKKLNKQVTTFCYPNGFPQDYNSDIIQILKDNGFLCSVTAIPQIVTRKSELFELGRVPPGYDDKSFKFCVSGLYSILNKLSVR